MKSIIKKTDLPALTSGFELLSQISAEKVWLANFSSDNTRDAYKRAVVEFIAFHGITSPEQLFASQQAHVIAWRSKMKSFGWSKTTIATRLSALSSLFKFLADKQLCPINPVSGVKRPKTGNGGLGSGKTPALTKKQVRAMLDAPSPTTLQGLRDRAILHVYFYTGGRVSEPGHLKVKDFRPDREYWVLELTTKGDKTNTVAIHHECQSAIRQYLDEAGHGEDRNSYLFRPVKNGNPKASLTRQQFYCLFRKYAEAAGLSSEITPHSARATFITHAYDAGWQGEDIQRTVGHSSITTTEGYNHTAKKHRKSASFAVNY